MTRKAVLRCAALAALVAAMGLSGCGRRGDLEPAPDSGVSARQARQQASQTNPAPATTIDGTKPAPRTGGVVPPKDPFVLDPLL